MGRSRRRVAKLAYGVSKSVGWLDIIRQRLEDLLRELGMLLLALAPLDGAIADTEGFLHPWKYVPLFVALGVGCFVLGLASEIKRRLQ